MNILHKTFVLTMALATGPVLAAGADADLDVTMSVISDEGSASDAVDRVIELPAQASDVAKEHAQHGLDTANQARERGRETGEHSSGEARQLREETRGGIGAEASAEARAMRNEVRTDVGVEVRPR